MNGTPDMVDNSADLMEYEARKKGNIVYVFWWFLGLFGGHRFYLGHRNAAYAQLTLTLSLPVLFLVAGASAGSDAAGFALGVSTFMWLVLMANAMWVFVDVLFLNRWVRDYNLALADELKIGSHSPGK